MSMDKPTIGNWITLGGMAVGLVADFALTADNVKTLYDAAKGSGIDTLI